MINRKKLEAAGWRVIDMWQCEVGRERREADLEMAKRIARFAGFRIFLAVKSLIRKIRERIVRFTLDGVQTSGFISYPHTKAT